MGWNMISSSSWRQKDVKAWREVAFQTWQMEGRTFKDHIPEFHLLKPKTWESWSPLMERETATTRSITQIEYGKIQNDEVMMRYWSAPHTMDISQPDIEKISIVFNS